MTTALERMAQARRAYAMRHQTDRSREVAALRQHEQDVQAARKRADEIAKENVKTIMQQRQADMDQRRFLENPPKWIPPQFGPWTRV